MIPEYRTVASMALLRLLSASIEITAAILMLRFGKVTSALQINAILGLVGPLILILVTTFGLIGISTKMMPSRLFVIVLGVILIIYGTRQA